MTNDFIDVKLLFAKSCRVHQTEKALLISIPNTAMSFWHPKSMCDLLGSGKISVKCPAGWVIKARKIHHRTTATLQSWDGNGAAMALKFDIEIEGSAKESGAGSGKLRKESGSWLESRHPHVLLMEGDPPWDQ